MKKIFTILGVSVAVFASAQTNLFGGSDFNDWTLFESSLGFAIKSAEQSTNGGVGGSGAMKIIDNTGTTNIYVMTANKNMNTTGINYITLKMKGVSGGISFNAGDGTLTGSKYFNIPAGTTSNVTLTATGANVYTGSINAADWITVTLDLTGVNWGATPTFSIKLQKSSTSALFVDDIKGSATLAVADFAKVNSTLVKNTAVGETIAFAKSADIQIINGAGQVVKSAKVSEGSTLNVSSLTKGTYIVTGSVNGEKVSQKIIKN